MKKFLVVLGVLMGGLLVSCTVPSNEPYESLSELPNTGVNRTIHTAEEYTLFYSGDTEATVVIQRDGGGKITITPNFKSDDLFIETIDHELCPLIPSTESVLVFFNPWPTAIFPDSIVIAGNTTTTINSDGSWEKEVVDGNITTRTLSDGKWYKNVFDGNITTLISSNGWWYKWVVDGNIKTGTSSDGSWSKSVFDGNITTETSSDGYWRKTVVDGNTTTKTSTFDGNRYYKTVSERVVDKQGRNVFIKNTVVSE